MTAVADNSPSWWRQFDGRTIWICLGLWVVLRLIFAAIVPLVPDEAFYWNLSRHLAPGYLDHPPLLAVFIWLSTAVFGVNELGVRFFAVILMAGTLAILLGLGKSLWQGDSRRLAVLAAFWFCSPMFHLLGMIFTPDTPSIFISTAAMGCFVIAARSEKKVILPWLLGGLFCGVAMTAKYTSVLLPAAIFWAVILSPQGRKELLRPWIWLGAILGVLAFCPVIYWNATHDWASFNFQIHHGLNTASGTAAAKPSFWEGVPLFIGMQLCVATPILFVVGVLTLVFHWRSYRSLDLGRQMLLWSATFPLVFFGFAASRSHGEANWPDFAYFPLSLLIIEWAAARDWSTRRWTWLRAGMWLAFALSVVIHAAPFLLRLPIKLPGKAYQLEGSRELAAVTDEARDAFAKLPPHLPKEEIPLVTSRHQDAAVLGFYLPDHPDVWAVSDPGKRSVAFEYFEPQPDFKNALGIIYVGKARAFAERFGKKMEKRSSPYTLRIERQKRNSKEKQAWDFSYLLPLSKTATEPMEPSKTEP